LPINSERSGIETNTVESELFIFVIIGFSKIELLVVIKLSYKVFSFFLDITPIALTLIESLSAENISCPDIILFDISEKVGAEIFIRVSVLYESREESL